VVRRLAARYPGDPGIAVSVLLNYVTLRAGEALFLPAGNIHAYLSGLGIELMASSDNVLRGGLTPKHVDVAELMTVLDFSPLPVPYLHPESVGGAQIYAPAGVPLALAHVTGPATLRPDGPAILLCVGGTGALTSTTLRRGESVLVTADEQVLTFSGDGDLYLAASGVSPLQGR
jgi:mannose-6-phosphate isomerase